MILFLLSSTLLLAQNIAAEGPRDLNKIRRSGVVRIGLRKSPTVYLDHDEAKSGENYVWQLVKAWAASEGLEAEPVFIRNFSEYWKRNGEIPEMLGKDKSLSYTPDVYSRIDLAADIFAILPWRESVVDMHRYIDVGHIIVARKDDGIKDPADLIGRTVFVSKTQAEYKVFLDFMERNALPWREIPVSMNHRPDGFKELIADDPDSEPDRDRINLLIPSPETLSALENYAYYELLLHDQADILINNSLTFFIYNMQFNSMRRYLAPVLSVSSEIIRVGVACPKESGELSRSLERFMKEAQTNGLNDRLLSEYAGVGLADYNRLIGDR